MVAVFPSCSCTVGLADTDRAHTQHRQPGRRAWSALCPSLTHRAETCLDLVQFDLIIKAHEVVAHGFGQLHVLPAAHTQQLDAMGETNPTFCQ